jgi:hypothetical protein
VTLEKGIFKNNLEVFFKRPIVRVSQELFKKITDFSTFLTQITQNFDP